MIRIALVLMCFAAVLLPAEVSAQQTFPVAVYFSKEPDSYNDFTLVFPLERTVVGPRVGTMALQHLIDGPTPEERADGYFSELAGMLDGPSVCEGADFSLNIVERLATVRFCRSLTSEGVGQDARVRSQIEATLLQFPTVERVRILDADGHCAFDLSGMDVC